MTGTVPATSETVPPVAELDRTQRLRQVTVLGLLLAAAAIFGPAAGALLYAGKPLDIVLFAVLLLPFLFWRVRAAPVVMVMAAATGFPRFPDPGADAITAKIPLFRSFSDSYGLSGAAILPIELILGLALLLWIADAITNRRLSVRSSHLGIAIAVFTGVTLLAELYGLARGAVFNISLWEVRPFLYVGLTYLLASQLLTSRRSMKAVLWAIVLGTGAMSILGAERTISTINVYPRPEAILEHDEAFFFGLFTLLTVGLWVFGQRGLLRVVATALLPLVILSDFGNNRRSAWVILPATLLALVIIAYQRMPERRTRITIVVAVLLVLGTGYTMAFRNSSAVYAEPAHGIWSQFRPDPRDYQSNLYREIENMNLGLDIRSSPVIGLGFGVPVPHPIPVFDASGVDPLINFIPHNTVLYVWMRMGSIGAVAFWFLIGAAVVAACRLARLPDAWYGFLGALVLSALIAWIAEGWFDKGIVSFRITILVGTLLGALEAARRLSVAGRLGREQAPAEVGPAAVEEPRAAA